MTNATAQTSYDKAEQYLKSQEYSMVEWIAEGLGVATEYKDSMATTVKPLCKSELVEALVKHRCDGEIVSEKVLRFLTEDAGEMTVKELKAECKKLGIKTTKKSYNTATVKMNKSRLIMSILQTSDYSLYF